MNRRFLATLLSALAMTLVTAPAVAQQAARPKTAPLAESLSGAAKSAYDSARRLYGAGDYAGAAQKYRAAYDASKEPRLQWNIAASEKNLRRYAKALPLVRLYHLEGDAVHTPQDRAEARELIEVMDPLTAKLLVVVNEAGAQVSIDDENQGRSPLRATLVDIGTRKIRVLKEGFEPFAKDVVVAGAGEVNVEVKLVKSIHEGRLVLRAPPDATLTLDGKAVGTGTFDGVVASGGHALRVTAPKMVLYRSEVLVEDNQTREVVVKLDPEVMKGVPLWAVIGGGAVAVTAVTVVVVLLATGGSSSSGGYRGPNGTIGTFPASHGISL